MNLLVRKLNLDDLENYVEHLIRHLPEPGVNGIISQPFSANEPIDKDTLFKKIQKRWSMNPGNGNWEVAWGIVDQSKIVSHLELIGASFPATNHRAKLGMGIEIAYRNSGYGRKLIEESISWARNQFFLRWIDLDVFAHNEVAIKLYKSVGFTKVGTTIDRLRVDGQSIDDCHFVFDLKN